MSVTGSKRLTRFLAWSQLYVVLGGVVSFLGWAADRPRLADWDDDGICIQPNAAIAAAAAGCALLALAWERRRVARALGALVAFIGGSVIFQYLSGIDLGIDALFRFGRTWGDRGVLFPGRMGPPGATSWALIGAGILLASLPAGSRGRRYVPVLASVAATISGLGLAGYLYGASPLYAAPTISVIALQTASFILVASLGLFATVPEHNPVRLLGQDSPGGTLARRALPVVLLVPILVGFARLLGEDLGIYDSAFGTALRTIFEILLLATFLGWTAVVLDRQARRRRIAEHDLRASRGQLQAELGDTTLLQRISTELVVEEDPQRFYGSVIDAAQRILSSDFASIQVLHPGRGAAGELQLLAHRGFDAASAALWEWVRADSECSCGRALKAKARVIVPDVEECDFMAGTEHLVHYRANGIRSVQSTPLVSRSGVLLGMISTHWREPRVPMERELRLLDILARQAADLIERNRSEAVIGRLNDRLSVDLAAMTRMHEVSTRLVQADDVPTLLQEIVDAATAITGADMGNIQLLEGKKLRIAAHRGFGAPFLDFFSDVHEGVAACGAAMRKGERVVVEDVRTSPYFEDSPARGILLEAGVRAVQSTPLRSRSGQLLGMFSTHYRSKRIPTENELRLLDLLARQAADLIERRQADRLREELLEKERAARSEAERAARLKDEFLATLSHELRTPLNAVIGWSEILRQDLLHPEKARVALEVIERNGRLQAQLITDLLDISRIISGNMRLELQPVDLPAVVEAAVESILPTAEARGVHIHRHLEPLGGPVRVDPARIQQVVWNLLSNAVKFTPRGGRVVVLLGTRNGNIEIRVSDTGEGIAPEFLPHLFERFRQADASTSRSHGGLGLGLAIVKQFVELHGGTVRAASEGRGKGATFVLSLPISIGEEPRGTIRPRPRPESAAPPDAAPAGLRGARVLLVEDEPDALAMLQRVFEDHGAEIGTASTSQRALDLLGCECFDLIVSDIGLAGRDGYELMTSVRARGIKTPALALTAFAGAQDRSRAMQSGYQAHVPKPVEAADLVATAASLLAPPA